MRFNRNRVLTLCLNGRFSLIFLFILLICLSPFVFYFPSIFQLLSGNKKYQPDSYQTDSYQPDLGLQGKEAIALLKENIAVNQKIFNLLEKLYRKETRTKDITSIKEDIRPTSIKEDKIDLVKDKTGSKYEAYPVQIDAFTISFNDSSLSLKERETEQLQYKADGFNSFGSDRLSLDRNIPDPRIPECVNLTYDEILPTTSIIITFQNEHLSMILRTVHSVINRSPKHLLHEIILIDDNSDRDSVKAPLEKHVNLHLRDVVKVIRLQNRSGITGARRAGAEIATGDVLMFLDSHCEVTVKWLEPLLTRIKLNRRVIVCPTVDTIDIQTFQLLYSEPLAAVGGFSWYLHFNWISIPQSVKRLRTLPQDVYRSATMSGGLFGIDRKYFWEIGGFDPGMAVWGAENLEMSFKTWMCGDGLEFVTCSRVAHLSRLVKPYSYPNNDYFGINCARLAEVWMEEYKDYFYMFKPEMKNINFGDISDRLKLKQKLSCRSFKWYLQNIYPEKTFINQNVFAWGRLRNENLCWDNLGWFMEYHHNVTLMPCSSSGSQLFSYSLNHEIRREEMCAAVKNIENLQFFEMEICHGHGNEQKWTHEKNGLIKNDQFLKCIERLEAPPYGKFIINDCMIGKASQMWTFDNYIEYFR